MKPKLIIAVVAIVAVIGGLLFLNVQKKGRIEAIIELSIPELPEPLPANAEFANRLQKANTSAQSSENKQEALEELSRLYHANGYSDKAMQAYKGLLAIDPKNPTWAYRAADILAEYGRLDEASPRYAEVTKLDPKYLPAYIRLGDTLLKQNRFEEASKAFSGAREIEKNNAYALVGLARIAIAAENFPEARELLEKSVEVSNFRIGADLLGDVYEIIGQEEKEHVVRQNILWGSYADMSDPWMTTLMSDCYDAYQLSIAGGWIIHEGDVKTGLRLVERAVKLEPDNSNIHYQIAGIYKRTNDLERASEHYERCVELQPDFADAWLSLMEIAKARRSPTGARRALERGLANCPDSPSLNMEKGDQLLARGEFDEALPYFERAVKHRPNEAGAYIQLAKAYMSVDRVDEAIVLMQTALEKEPGNPIAITTMLFNAIMKADQEEADHWFREVKKQARIKDNEINSLVARYQSQFGRRPNL